MPKEIIKDPYAGLDVKDYTSGAEATTHYPELQAEISWGREVANVQLGVINLDEGDGSHDPSRGWYMDLDREAINRMIRVLRRARDQAYGADA